MTAPNFTSGAERISEKGEGHHKGRFLKKSRVQLDFEPRSMERLHALKMKTEASSYAEVVKNALRLYEALIEETEGGKQFFARDKNGTMAPFRFFL